jgi:hypothetical protein
MITYRVAIKLSYRPLGKELPGMLCQRVPTYAWPVRNRRRHQLDHTCIRANKGARDFGHSATGSRNKQKISNSPHMDAPESRPPRLVGNDEIKLSTYKRPGEPEHYRLSNARTGLPKPQPQTTPIVSQPAVRKAQSSRLTRFRHFWFKTRYISGLASHLSSRNPHLLDVRFGQPTAVWLIRKCVENTVPGIPEGLVVFRELDAAVTSNLKYVREDAIRRQASKVGTCLRLLCYLTTPGPRLPGSQPRP